MSQKVSKVGFTRWLISKKDQIIMKWICHKSNGSNLFTPRGKKALSAIHPTPFYTMLVNSWSKMLLDFINTLLLQLSQSGFFHKIRVWAKTSPTKMEISYALYSFSACINLCASFNYSLTHPSSFSLFAIKPFIL